MTRMEYTKDYFLRYLRNKLKDNELPPFAPVLHKSVDITHPNHDLITAIYIHKSLMKLLTNELVKKIHRRGTKRMLV